jgi:hypothetical protein
MPIKLFARIRVRRGLKADLPNPLMGSEFGHALDTQELFIGNGTLSDGAPVIGNTQILTTETDNSSAINYTYKSNTDVAPQTGPSPTTPTVRTLQEVLDDNVSIKDFGVMGDNSTDDSAAFNLATLQLYTKTAGETSNSYWRKLFIPAGSYLMSANELIIPSNAHIVGEGKLSTVIYLDSGSSLLALFQTADSLGQTGASIGSNSAELPSNIIIENMSFVCNAASATSLAQLISVSNIIFKNCYFSLAGTGTMFSLSLMGTATSMSGFTFDNCEFQNYAQLFPLSPTVNVSNVSMTNCVGVGELPNFNNTAVVADTIQNVAKFAQPSISLAASQSDTTFATFPLSTIGNALFINYTLIQSGVAVQIGKLSVVTDGTLIELGDDNHQSAATNVSFSASISGGNIVLAYTSGAVVSTMYYSVEFWGNT